MEPLRGHIFFYFNKKWYHNMIFLTLLAICIGFFAIFIAMLVDLYYWITEIPSVNLGMQALLIAIILILIAACIKMEKTIQQSRISE
jgi:hypothetical protein